MMTIQCRVLEKRYRGEGWRLDLEGQNGRYMIQKGLKQRILLTFLSIQHFFINTLGILCHALYLLKHYYMTDKHLAFILVSTNLSLRKHVYWLPK